MSTLKLGRELWKPQTERDRDAVLRELHAILESPYFCNSKRYPMFLRYVVECSLQGKAHLIKERTIGVEVFGRPSDYDTNSDTVVRYTAGEVRKRLSLYYHEHEATAPVQITLPAGSYVPEFVTGAGTENTTPQLQDQITGIPAADAALPSHPVEEERNVPANHRISIPEEAVSPVAHAHREIARLRALLSLAVLLLVLAPVLFLLRGEYSRTDVDRFWSPLFRERGPILVSSGAVVFAPERFSGVVTADKTVEYPFVSMQLVTALTRLTGVIERQGSPYEIRSASFLTLTDMRERPTVLVGGYNNLWTMQLVSPLRFYFSPVPKEAIVDRDHPGVAWSRDPKLPYSSADDYALVARFRDPTTDSLIFVVAGLGRNGTEAAAQFVTTPRYLEQLKDQVGSGWTSRNLEAVIKTKVIDGRTGAPSIVAAHIW